MTLAEERLKQLDNPDLPTDERILLRCRLAAELIHTGRYEDAGKALGPFWRDVGERPDVGELPRKLAAELLLQVGALSGWIGASRQAAGAQEAAKDLISESVMLFEQSGESSRAAASRSELAICYWREGSYDEARVLLNEAAALAGDDDLRARITLRSIVVESSAGRYVDAFRLLTDSAPLFEQSENHALRGRFHNELAIVLRRLGVAERQPDYLDRAVIEYTAAIYHYEQARHERYKATNENNLAFLLYMLGRYREAHEYLDRASVTLVKLNDAGLLAQVDETRARVLIAEKQYREAGRFIAGAVQTLEKGGASALLSDALTIQGIVWAKVGAYEESANVLRRAADVAEESGALSNAGQSLLTLIEEHGARRALPPDEVYDLFRRADRLLKDTQDAADISRLRRCAQIVMRRLAGVPLDDRNYTLFGAVHELEARHIEKALEQAGGSVTRAARILGIRRQTLGAMLNTRHKKLLKKRTPPERRLRSIIEDEE